MSDEVYMRRALELAQRGVGKTDPNPVVGCVIVKDDVIIGEGFHARAGGDHAEVAALKDCEVDCKGATMYVTLEPCCHFGKTPPCVDAILEAGIGRVVIGCVDENPLVSGGGISILRERGVLVTVDVLKKECREINKVFFARMG